MGIRRNMKEAFRRTASKVSNAAGHPTTFLGAVLIVLIWATSGPLFDFSNTWQLVINTGTTIITFLMVFLIQNTQNRDGKAMQLKLDELIRASQARNVFIDLEDLTDDEMSLIADEFQKLHSSTGNQTYKKVHTKFKEVHEKRRSLAEQVTDALNPFSNNDSNKENKVFDSEHKR
jgi:low affinity Fe/Cu permease